MDSVLRMACRIYGSISAEDLELSCDETVLLGEDEDTRKRYAELPCLVKNQQHLITIFQKG